MFTRWGRGLDETGPMGASPKAWMSWSSGKDSAMALDVVRSAYDVEITALLTTVNADADRIAMHAVRRTLLEAQADRLGLPLVIVAIPSPCPNEVYEARMAEAIATALADGVAHVVFGDLFLGDVRAYREERLAGTGISPIFPLWDRPTDVLARAMLESGLKAVITLEPYTTGVGTIDNGPPPNQLGNPRPPDLGRVPVARVERMLG